MEQKTGRNGQVFQHSNILSIVKHTFENLNFTGCGGKAFNPSTQEAEVGRAL